MPRALLKHQRLNLKLTDLMTRARLLLETLTAHSDAFRETDLSTMSRDFQLLRTMEKDLSDLEKIAQTIVLEVQTIEDKDREVTQLEIEIEELRNRLSELEQFAKR